MTQAYKPAHLYKLKKNPVHIMFWQKDLSKKTWRLKICSVQQLKNIELGSELKGLAKSFAG